MKIYKKLLSFIFIILFLFSFSINSKSQFADINFEFQKDTRYSNLEINNQFTNTSNLRNQTYMDLGNYPASYTFKDESGLEGLSIPFIDFISRNPSNTFISVSSEFNEHSEILNCSDKTLNNFLDVSNLFDNQINPTIEFWFLVSNITTSDGAIIRFYEGITSVIINMEIDDNDLLTSSTGGILKLDCLIANQWNHVKFVLDDTANTFDFYFNSILEKNDLAYITNSIIGIDEFQIGTGTNDIIDFYFDAIGYSWGITPYDDLLDFTDDIVGNEPIGWLINNGVGCSSLISSSLDSRTKILNLFDGDIGHIPNICNISKDFIIPIEQSIQLDIAISEIVIDQNYFRFYEGNTLIVDIKVQANDIYNYDGGYNLIKSNFISENIFFILGMVFNHEANTLDVYINGILEGSSLGYRNSINNEISGLEISTSPATSFPYSLYIDNIYINPSYYSVGSNIFPLIIETDYLEVDKYEFAMAGVNTLHPLGYNSDINGWGATEYQTGSLEVISYDVGKYFEIDRRLSFEVVDTSDYARLSKTGINKTETFIEISFDFKLTSGNLKDSTVAFLILPYDGLMVAKLRIDFSDMKLYYDNGPGYTELKDNLGIDVNYIIKMKINYEIDVCFYSFYEESELIDEESFALLEIGETGLFSVIVDMTSSGEDSGMELDSIGIYVNERSQNKVEYAWTYIRLGAGYWNSENQNIFDYYSNGTYKFWISQGAWFAVGEPVYHIKAFSLYNNTNTIRNTYGMDENKFAPLAVCGILGSNFRFESLTIEGVLLSQDTNEYHLEFSYGGINPNESYFYVDGSNKLQFIHYSDGSGTDFIQATFNFEGIISNETVISWSSRRDNNAYAYFRVKFESTSNVYELRPFVDSRKVLLESGKTIDQFIVLVSNNGLSEISGFTTGYIKSISIEYAPAIIISVITLNLVGMLIPLMIILIPTIAISEYYGKSLFVPSFMIFTIILGITGLIPLWLFFTTILSCSVFIFTKKEKEVV